MIKLQPLSTTNHFFTSPVDIEIIDKIRAIYKQGEVSLIKEKESMKFNGSQIQISLSQDETFLFNNENDPVKFQMQIITTGGQSLVSKWINMRSGLTLFEETY